MEKKLNNQPQGALCDLFLKGNTVMKKILAVLLSLGVLLSLAACNPRQKKVTREIEAMDTYMKLEMYDVDALAVSGIEANISWYDRALSVTNADGTENELYRLNQEGSSAVSPSVAELTRQTLALCEETDGALDISVCPLVEEWGFYSKDYRIPSGERLAQLLPLVDYRQVSVSGDTIRLGQKGMKLDFGAVAKGWLADESVKILEKNAAQSAILNFGGTVAAFRTKPDGSLWRVGIADPDNSATFMGTLSCRDKVIATSGSYERSFVGDDGKTYSHILNPKTGVPVESDILSVTIISDSGLRSDGLSTALFVMGREEAERYRQAHHDFDYIILTKDKKAYVTAGVADSFAVADGYAYEIVRVA